MKFSSDSNFRIMIVQIAIVILCTSFSSFAESQDDNNFLSDLFSPVKLIEYGVVPPPQYSSLTELDKKNLLEAKNVLVDFLKSHKNPYTDPIKYLLPSLRAKYEDRVILWRKEFGAEALIEIKIFSFIVKGQNKDEIVFYAALTDTTEGVDRSIPTAFALKKTGDTWKISRFVRDIKDLEKELIQ